MAKTKEIEVRFSRTFNLGNYQSARIELAKTITVGPEDDDNQIINETYAYLCKKVHALREGKNHVE